MGGFMKIRKITGILLITAACFLTTGSREAYCAQTYQAEAGVNGDVWGRTGDAYLRQLLIKYNIDRNSVFADFASVDLTDELKEYLKKRLILFQLLAR
jgi:hypothetical protein